MKGSSIGGESLKVGESKDDSLEVGILDKDEGEGKEGLGSIRLCRLLDRNFPLTSEDFNRDDETDP